MRRLVALVAAGLLVTQSAMAQNRMSATIAPQGSKIVANGYSIDLGDADDPDHPRAWQGPVSITGPTGKRCTVSDEVGIVEQPLAMLRGHLLYVSTYSGSEGTLYVVDANTCAIRWSSPRFEGKAAISPTALLLPGRRRLLIGATGLPH